MKATISAALAIAAIVAVCVATSAQVDRILKRHKNLCIFCFRENADNRISSTAIFDTVAHKQEGNELKGQDVGSMKSINGLLKHLDKLSKDASNGEEKDKRGKIILVGEIIEQEFVRIILIMMTLGQRLRKLRP